ncbi:MAG: tetratricopeptide repeat protein [Bacteroidales bacterium]|jgi:tetratricopeptide (TPR) repeat protein|nr:tetratricopeptide repeat protein [Bacteroidales bacterium]MDD4213171.1 tetratricopeptide repeat protein [Bacteroidales bacterium]
MKRLITYIATTMFSCFVYAQAVDSIKNKIIIRDNGNAMEITMGDSSVTISYEFMYEKYLLNGVEKANDGNFESALADFNVALLYITTDPQAYYNKGLAYYYLKQYDMAIENYNVAVELDSNYEEAYGQRGIVKSLSGDPEGAKTDFRKAILIKPEKGLNYYNYGIALLVNDEIDEGCQQMIIALKLGYSDAENVILKYCH